MGASRLSFRCLGRSCGPLRAAALFALVLGMAGAGQAGPAMFSASLVQHAFGNDYTAGGAYPYNTYVLTALPVGRACGAFSPYTASGAADPAYCSKAIREAGEPAVGSGVLSLTATGMLPVPFKLPQSALGITASGSFRPRATVDAVYTFRGTHADFVNAAGSFFAGGGPGNRVFAYPGGLFQGAFQIKAGPNRFGGVMGLLGQLGVAAAYTKPGQTGRWEATRSWNMAAALGRKVASKHTATAMFHNAVLGTSEIRTMMASGAGWTTGTVFATARLGGFTTSMSRRGYDNRTAMGLGTIQLVTPVLTHWIDGSPGEHTAQIGILRLHFAPEPEAALGLAAGALLLLLLRRARRLPASD